MSVGRRTIAVMRETSAAAKECPLAPPEHATVHARAIHRACLVLGGAERLARHLDVALADLVGWLRGESPPPERVFLAAVEIILLHASGEGRPS